MKITKIIASLIIIAVTAHCSDRLDSWVQLNDIASGQLTMSQEAWQEVADNTYGRPRGFTYDIQSKEIKYSYNNGTSPFNKVFKVLKAPDDFPRPYILTDGYHTMRGISEAIKKQSGDVYKMTIPVQIDDHLACLPINDFW